MPPADLSGRGHKKFRIGAKNEGRTVNIHLFGLRVIVHVLLKGLVRRNTHKHYYTLRSSLQILRSAMLDEGKSRAGDLKSGSVYRGVLSYQNDCMCLNVHMLHVH